jgi:membrane protein implicated in regulation of membrane protease activity
MSGRRGLTIALATLATILAVFMLLLIPVSLTLGRFLNVVLEAVVLVACVGYVARVMRADRRRRREAEASLPPERRPERRVPRRPITFQFRETLIAFLVWFVLVIAFNSLVVQLGPVPNVGIAVFAAFMLATLTVTGRHMMFRLTAEEDTPPER